MCVENIHPRISFNIEIKIDSRPQTIFNIGSENYSGKKIRF